MKNKKTRTRLLSTLLLVCILVSLLPANAFAQVATVETTSAVNAPTVKAATSYVTQINSLPVPYNVEYDMSTYGNKISGTSTYVGFSLLTNGHPYYIVNLDSSGKTGHIVNMNEDFTEEFIVATDVTVSNGTVTNANPDWAFTFEESKKADGVTYWEWRTKVRPVRGMSYRLAALSADKKYVRLDEGTPLNNAGQYFATPDAFSFFSYWGNDTYILRYVPSANGFSFTLARLLKYPPAAPIPT